MKKYLFQAPRRNRQSETYRKSYTHYWQGIERKFRLRRFIKKPKFILHFKHSVFSDITYDDELVIERIADYYGYRISAESLSGSLSTYMFVQNEAS